MNITVIGAGYVGHVVATCLGSLDHDVTVYDIDHDKLDSLEDGEPVIHEPGLDERLDDAIRTNSFHVEKDIDEAVDGSQAIFLCVGTPPAEDGSVNLDYHYAAVDELKPLIDDQSVIIKSTVPPGTAAETKERLGHDDVYNNPEFLKEGSAVNDFLTPDRVVIGADDHDRAESLARNLYQDILDDAELFITSNESAELIKYASNAFLATKISYANELARLCDATGADIDDVTTGMALDNRIKDAFFGAGAGYGGSCFPKDTKALVNKAKDLGEDMKIVQAAEDVNDEQRHRIIDDVADELGELDDTTVGVLGLAFKPGTDDVRESPAITVIQGLVRRGAKVKAHDPQATENFKQRVDADVAYEDTAKRAVSHTDAVILLTDWEDYTESLLNDATFDGYVYDARNTLSTAMVDADTTQVGKP